MVAAATARRFGRSVNAPPFVPAAVDQGLQQIIRTGDQLAGSGVLGLSFPGTVFLGSHSPDTSFDGLNNAGQVASAFTLEDSTNGIAVWSQPALADDYNGIIDAADYVVWRDTLGQTGSDLAADGNGNGAIDTGDYDVWRAHFSQAVGSGASASANAAIPEPATLVLLLVGILAMSSLRRAAVS